jgi:hypothetical protein
MSIVSSPGTENTYSHPSIARHSTRREAAWMILHKLRRATVNANRTKLRGRVEVDETWVGGDQAGATGRTRVGRRAALVVLALEVGDGFPGRLRTRLVPDDTAASLVGFVSEVVEVGSTVITDGWTAYLALPEASFIHEWIVEGRGEGFSNSVPHLHHTVGNLKAWLTGSAGSISPPTSTSSSSGTTAGRT